MDCKEINGVFDALSPTQEQKDRMLNNILNSKQKTVKFYIPKYAIAAIVCIGVFASVYPNISNYKIAVDVQKESTSHEKVEENTEVLMPKTADDTPLKEEGSIKIAVLEKTEAPKSEAPAVIAEENVVVPEMSVTVETEADYAEVYDPESVPSIARSMDFDEQNVAEAEAYTDEEIEESVNFDATDTTASIPYVAMATEIADEYVYTDYEELMQSEVYSSLLPKEIVGDFEFESARETEGVLDVQYTDGNAYMTISISSEISNDITDIEDVKKLSQHDKHMNFTLECGDYYVTYNIESGDAEAVYEMAVSSEYFSN